MSRTFSSQRNSLAKTQPHFDYQDQYYSNPKAPNLRPESSQSKKSQKSLKNHREKLAKYLSSFGDLEIEIEALKKNLAKMHNFVPFSYFYHLTKGNFHLLDHDLLQLPQKYGFRLKLDEISALMRPYCRNHRTSSAEQYWSFSDFLSFIFSSEELTQLFIQQHGSSLPHIACKPPLQINHIEKFDLAFIMLILKEREMQLVLHEARKSFHDLKKLDLFSMLSETDRITEGQLYEFVKQKMNMRISRGAAALLVARIDEDADGRIGVKDFISFFSEFGLEDEELRKYERKMEEYHSMQRRMTDIHQKVSSPKGYNISNFQDLHLTSTSTYQKSQHLQPIQDQEDCLPTPSFEYVRQNPKRQSQPAYLKNNLTQQIKLERCSPLRKKPSQVNILHTEENSSSPCLNVQPAFTSTGRQMSTPFILQQENSYLEDLQKEERHEDLLNRQHQKVHFQRQKVNPEEQSSLMEQINQCVPNELPQIHEPVRSSEPSTRNNVTINERLFEALGGQDKDSSIEYNSKFNITHNNSVFKDLYNVQPNSFGQHLSVPLQEFLALLKIVIESEKELDRMRTELIQNQFFDFVAAFRLIDAKKDGKISTESLKKALHAYFQLVLSDREVSLLMAKYQKDGQGYFRFSDFCEMLTPKEPSSYIQSCIKSKFMDCTHRQLNIKQPLLEIREVISQVVKQEMEVEMCKFRITSIEADTNQDLPVEQLFKQLDSKQRQYITKRQISEFLVESANYFASEREMKIIMGVLDPSARNYLRLEDLQLALTPFTYQQ